MKNTRKILLLAALAALSACSSVKKELGVGRNSPDEFTVVKRAPLSLPPDYDLRPPASGTAPAAATATGSARAAVLGSATSDAPQGSAEEQLLRKMGAQNADPDVRAAIAQDNGYIALRNKSVADKLIFWEEDAEAPADKDIPGSVVDAKAEKERLEKNKAEGKPANDGDIPVIEKKPSTIDKIF